MYCNVSSSVVIFWAALFARMIRRDRSIKNKASEKIFAAFFNIAPRPKCLRPGRFRSDQRPCALFSLDAFDNLTRTEFIAGDAGLIEFFT
jgi:hypothetical protein